MELALSMASRAEATIRVISLLRSYPLDSKWNLELSLLSNCLFLPTFFPLESKRELAAISWGQQSKSIALRTIVAPATTRL